MQEADVLRRLKKVWMVGCFENLCSHWAKKKKAAQKSRSASWLVKRATRKADAAKDQRDNEAITDAADKNAKEEEQVCQGAFEAESSEGVGKFVCVHDSIWSSFLCRL